jgi:hypothetical protein
MLRTDVDDFLDLVKRKGRVSLNDAAKQLKIPLQTVQSWADFLVEEKILGMEYKFTTPYVFLNAEPDDKLEFKDYMHFDTREQFYEKAQNKGLNAGQIKLLWLKYLNYNKTAMRNMFYDKAGSRGLDNEHIEKLWKKYFEFIQREG